MHYFQFEIKEWISNTTHLSLEEEGAYLRLIFFYYDSEKPFPSNELDKIFRRCRIPSDLGCYILSEYFTNINDCWIHNRCDQEIEKYRLKIDHASKAGKASAKRRLNNTLTTVQPIINQESLIINQDKNILVNNGIDSLVNCPHEEIISLYHSILPTLRKVEIWNETRKSYLKARWREAFDKFKLTTKQEGIDYFAEVFEIVKSSPFLLGQTNNKDGKAFQADLEWILKPTNFVKIIERKYSK